MSKTHIVEKNESIYSIAAKYNFFNPDTLYEHPDNADLQEKRPKNDNGNVLLKEGDEVVIPDKTTKDASASTGGSNSFTLKRKKQKLALCLQNQEGTPYANKPWRLEVDGIKIPFEGSTDGDGLMEQELPVDCKFGKLTLRTNEGNGTPTVVVWDVDIGGGLDPVDEVTGIQQRLHNLGIPTGKVDGIYGPLTEGCIQYFQSLHNLKIDGDAGPKTQAILADPTTPETQSGEEAQEEELAQIVSDIKKREKLRIDLIVVDNEDVPLAYEPYRISHSDGKIEKGVSGALGEIKIKNVSSKNYLISFPDLQI